MSYTLFNAGSDAESVLARIRQVTDALQLTADDIDAERDSTPDSGLAVTARLSMYSGTLWIILREMEAIAGELTDSAAGCYDAHRRAAEGRGKAAPPST